ncbi:hypothetical protein B0H14DRAFT_2555123 [Mycena olivaceomarginata]|nr:hypothetical protein B0H14DRAFT_2555123 [Mycena olivaceomarginata]
MSNESESESESSSTASGDGESESDLPLLTDSDNDADWEAAEDADMGKLFLCLKGSKQSSHYVVWTALKPPHYTTTPNPAHSPPNALVFVELPENVRLKRTMKAIKRDMKLYTVGPLDFCGHAKAIPLGSSHTLSWEKQKFVKSSWDAIGTWPKGFRKSSKVEMLKEKPFNSDAFYEKTRNQLMAASTSNKRVTEDDVDVELARLRKKRRISAARKTKVATDEEEEMPISLAGRFRSARLNSFDDVPTASSLLGINKRGLQKRKPKIK